VEFGLAGYGEADGERAVCVAALLSLCTRKSARPLGDDEEEPEGRWGCRRSNIMCDKNHLVSCFI
jgi:hypothetical protein